MEPTAAAPKLLNACDAAERLAISVPRVYELVRLSMIPSVRFGRTVRIPPLALDAWIERGGQPLDS